MDVPVLVDACTLHGNPADGKVQGFGRHDVALLHAPAMHAEVVMLWWLG
jgi:hypothetical protein